MSKSFIYFLWWVSLFIFLFLALYFGFGLFLAPQINKSITGNSITWTENLGMVISWIVLLPLYKLFKLLPKIKLGIDGDRILLAILLQSLWFLIPIGYLMLVLR